MARAPQLELNRAMSLSSSTGTGNMVIESPPAGFVGLDSTSFPMWSDDTLEFYYCIEGIEGDCLGQIEIGIGRIESGELLRSSEQRTITGVNTWSYAACNFAAGTKRIFARTVAPTFFGSINMLNFCQELFVSGLGNAVRGEGSTEDDTPTVLSANTFWALVNDNFEIAEGAMSIRPLELDDPVVLVFDLMVRAAEVPSWSNAKAWRLTFMVQKLPGNDPILLGTPSIEVLSATGGASAWTVAVGIDDLDVTITATGADATLIDWLVSGRFMR